MLRPEYTALSLSIHVDERHSAVIWLMSYLCSVLVQVSTSAATVRGPSDCDRRWSSSVSTPTSSWISSNRSCAKTSKSQWIRGTQKHIWTRRFSKSLLLRSTCDSAKQFLIVVYEAVHYHNIMNENLQLRQDTSLYKYLFSSLRSVSSRMLRQNRLWIYSWLLGVVININV